MAGVALTEQHRGVQLAIRAQALRDFAKIWPLWRPNAPESFDQLVQASQPLVTHYSGLSAAAAASYYEAFRGAEGVTGVVTPRLAAAPAETMIRASLNATGEAAARTALAAGQPPAAVRETTLVRASGAVARHVLNGGRNTILASIQADRQAIGWVRVTDGNPCYFCLTLASRGAVYKSEQTADFQAHDHCGCVAMPLWEGTQLPDATARYQEIYDAAQRAAVESGLLHPGENSSDARLNAVRRYLAAQ